MCLKKKGGQISKTNKKINKKKMIASSQYHLNNVNLGFEMSRFSPVSTLQTRKIYKQKRIIALNT
jgi:hypothetical protein